MGRSQHLKTVARCCVYASGLCLSPLWAQSPQVLLATTTSTRDAGLLDSLLPVFEGRSGYKVKVIAVGSGQALEMARRGDADVVLSHAPEAEQVYVDSGFLVNRRRVMHNDFLIVGPREDPAAIRGLDPLAAFGRLARGAGAFVSRGDRSGTQLLERKLWRSAGIAPSGSWYIESGQGMAATLQMADQKHAYTLSDRATYLAWRDRLQLVPLVEGDTLLYNVYHVMEARDARNPAGARLLADFFVSSSAQELIGKFGRSRFGRSLFVPDALESLVPPNR